MHLSAQSIVLSLTICFTVSGCTQLPIAGAPDFDRRFFGSQEKLAVVSIASLRTIQVEKGMSQLFKSPDAIPGANTQPIIDRLRPKIIRALGSSKYFTLLPENTVLTSKAYRHLVEDEKVMTVLFISEGLNVANNYKYVSDQQKYSKLARDLGVDGVIGITMEFSIAASKNMASIAESNLGKRNYSAMASILINAYNKDGETIWKDSIVAEAAPGDSRATILLDTSAMTSADFEKFLPSAAGIGESALDVLIARFDAMMAGKTVSSMQTIK